MTKKWPFFCHAPPPPTTISVWVSIPDSYLIIPVQSVSRLRLQAGLYKPVLSLSRALLINSIIPPVVLSEASFFYIWIYRHCVTLFSQAFTHTIHYDCYKNYMPFRTREWNVTCTLQLLVEQALWKASLIKTLVAPSLSLTSTLTTFHTSGIS